MDKRYQVFVSSTYMDLQEERAEVMQALLELDCMPSGMELFPAANETQWNWIKKVIQESDYYIVIVGGRYGSLAPQTGLSYTEMEYRFAVEIQKPVIAFLHEDISKIISGKSETDKDLRSKLEAFRKLVQTRLCKHYSGSSDLGAKVSRSITQLIKSHPAVGWIRADSALSAETTGEILSLRREIEMLKAKLKRVSTEKPEGSEGLVGGTDETSLEFEFRCYRRNATGGLRVAERLTYSCVTTWDEILKYLAPRMIEGCPQGVMHRLLSSYCVEAVSEKIFKKFKIEKFDNLEVSADCFNTVFIQLRALGFIEASKKEGFWTLSAYGDRYLNAIIAIRKKPAA